MSLVHSRRRMLTLMVAGRLLAPVSALTLHEPHGCPAVGKGYTNVVKPCDRHSPYCCPSEFEDLDDEVSFEEDRMKNDRRMTLTFEESCEGCDFTIDLRCKEMRSPARHAFFHRLTECLLPRYALIQKAREAKGQRCILTWQNDHEIDLVPFLSSLAEDVNARIVNEDLPCVADMDYHSAEPTWGTGASQDYIEKWPTLPHIAGRVPLDMAANMNMLHKDTWDASGPNRQPNFIFVTRHSGERNFEPQAETRIAESMRNVAEAIGKGAYVDWSPQMKKSKIDVQNVEYKGAESVRDTIKMFAHTVGVVGYHGAGFANTLFIGHPACIEEITTYGDADEHTIWRTNAPLADRNPFLVWERHIVKREEQFAVNKVKPEGTDLNQVIKHFRIVRVTESETTQLEKQFIKCLERNVFAAATSS